MIFFIHLICFLNWYIDIYIDVCIYKLFQMGSIQIDLGTCFNRGYMIFVYIIITYFDLQQQHNTRFKIHV